MKLINDRLKPALDWCKRRELERMSASIAKGGVGVSPIESHTIYTVPLPLNAIHREKSNKTLDTEPSLNNNQLSELIAILNWKRHIKNWKKELNNG